MELHEALEPVLDTLHAAYPDGLPEGDYPALLVVLGEGLGEENLGKVVAEFTGTDEHLAIHDWVDAAYTHRRPPADVARVRELLIAKGWDPDD